MMRLHKIVIFFVLASVAVLFGFKNDSNTNNHTKQPDIFLFIADDMTLRDYAPYGNTDVITPNLSNLAKEGPTFGNMHNCTSMCSSTRQSLYTGIAPVKSGSYPNHAKVYNNIISIVQHFHKIGYRVALLRKQHYALVESFPFEYLGGRNTDNGKGHDIEIRDAEKFIQKNKND